LEENIEDCLVIRISDYFIKPQKYMLLTNYLTYISLIISTLLTKKVHVINHLLYIFGVNLLILKGSSHDIPKSSRTISKIK